MSNINKAAVLNPFNELTANILNYVPRATTSEFGIVAIGSGINVDALGRIYLDTQEYSDRLTVIEAQAASSLATQKSEVAAAIAQVNLTQSQTITALTLEVDNLKTNLTDSITATQTELINRADQLAQDVTDITVQLTQDKATFTQEIQDALDFLENAGSVASALRTPRKINGVDFDGTQDITLPLASTSVSGTVQLNNTLTSINTDHALTAAQGKVLNDSKLGKTENAVSASKLETSRTLSLTGGVTGSVSFDGSANASIATAITGLGVANGIATLDSNGQVPSTQLPSYVDDVLEYANVAAFPTTGVAGKIYVETMGNTTYRWGGTAYVKITSGEVSSVAGKVGVVNLSKADVGLANVDNTPDTQKPISEAIQLALNDKVNKADVISVAKGGTGATTAAEARTNLGLGSASTRNVGTQTGNVMEVGAFGLGGNAKISTTQPHTLQSGMFEFGTEVSNLPFDHANGYGAFGLNLTRGGIGAFLYAPYNGYQNNFIFRTYDYTGVASYKDHVLRDSRNTTIDANGFIKNASPIANLFADKIELNDEAKDQNIAFEKPGIGDYLIKGSSGFAQEGWYVEQPKDANGNTYHAVEYGTHPNGNIWLKTYEQMMDGTRIVADHSKPIDIKENRFISVRLNALPEDTTAPINPTIKDNEGIAAPSRLHELVDGVWVISDENAAILEQERLAAMKPLKRRQFRLTLAMNGYDLKEIETLIDQIEDPMQRTIAQIEWQDATDFERTNPTLLMMTELMQLTSEQIDQLWNYGLTL